MYLSQPGPAMYPHGRPLLIPRVSMGPTTAAMLSQQPLHYPGGPGPAPGQPPPGGGVGGPRMMGMPPPYTHYMAPGFGVPMFTAPPNTNTNPPPGMMRSGPPEPHSNGSDRNNAGGSVEKAAVSITPQIISPPPPPPPSSSAPNNPSQEAVKPPIVKPPPGLAKVRDNGSSGARQSGISKASAGRRNYKVAGSPGRVPNSPSRNSEMSSAGGGQPMEVKAVSVTPRLATRVEEPAVPLGEFSEIFW